MNKNETDPRTYDKEGFKRRAGCVCIKDDQQNEVFCWFLNNCVLFIFIILMICKW